MTNVSVGHIIIRSFNGVLLSTLAREFQFDFKCVFILQGLQINHTSACHLCDIVAITFPLSPLIHQYYQIITKQRK